MQVTFHGVRGSTPCSCEGNHRYGGNTACVSLEAPGSDPVIFDLGTGLRFFGDDQPADGSFRAHALVTHLHWDHVQGLPFCVPVNQVGAQLDVYGPPQDGAGLASAFDEFMRPPYFPVGVADLMGDIHFHTVSDEGFVAGDAKVRARYVPHIGPTLGYRVELAGVTVAYISDHQQPQDGGFDIRPEVLELADGADLLIHDAQYLPHEFQAKRHWGHCTIDYALHVAKESGAKRLALFHHDPAHTDEMIDAIVLDASDQADALGLDEVVAASEGLTLDFSSLPAAAR